MTLLNYLVVHIFMLQLEFICALYCGVLSQKTCLASKKVLKITALSALVSSIVVSISHDFVTIVLKTGKMSSNDSVFCLKSIFSHVYF